MQTILNLRTSKTKIVKTFIFVNQKLKGLKIISYRYSLKTLQERDHICHFVF